MTEPRRAAALVGTILFLGSWAMSFVALLFAYGVVRAGAPMWPPPPLTEVPGRLAIGATVTALASSVLLAQARRSGRLALAGLAAALGGAMLWFQLRAAVGLASAGAELQDPSAAVIYALLGFHAVHAALGGFGLAGAAALSAWRRRRQVDEGSALALWSMFWHFVVGAWLAIYLAVFVV